MLKITSKKIIKSIAYAIPLIICTDLANCMRHIEIPLSETEKGILSREVPLQESTQSDIFYEKINKYAHNREELEKAHNMFKEAFYGDGTSEYSRCFKKYVEGYLEQFISSEELFSGDYGEMRIKCLELGADLLKIMRGSLKECHVELGKVLMMLSFQLTSEKDLDYLVRVLKESAFWYCMATADNEMYEEGLQEIFCNLHSAIYRQQMKDSKSTSTCCCNIL